MKQARDWVLSRLLVRWNWTDQEILADMRTALVVVKLSDVLTVWAVLKTASTALADDLKTASTVLTGDLMMASSTVLVDDLKTT